AFHSARAVAQRALRPRPGSSGWVISLKSLLEWIAVSWAGDGAAVPGNCKYLCGGRLFLFAIAMPANAWPSVSLDPAVHPGKSPPGPLAVPSTWAVADQVVPVNPAMIASFSAVEMLFSRKCPAIVFPF